MTNKVCISILLIFIILTMNGIATTDDNVQSIFTNIDTYHVSTNVDMKKIKDIVKNVDYNKLINTKSEDFPVITEDWMSGIARVDYVYYGKFDAKIVKRTNDISSISSYCYKTFGKWSSTPIYYVINPSNSQGISQDLITSSIFASAETWDNVVSRNLFSDTYTIDSNANTGVYDGRNIIDFGSYNSPGVIAVTSVWYNIYTKQIYEFDIRFNTAFTWRDVTTNSDSYIMDIRNIATHEIAHGAGLRDLYQSYCSQATMYGYSGYRDIQKRTLESGDINGIRKIYGN